MRATDTLLQRRHCLQAALALACGLPAAARAQAALQHLGIVSLLGDSVRVVAREISEVSFKDAALDDVACTAARSAAAQRFPQAQFSVYSTSKPLLVDEQRAIGSAAAERGELPGWLRQVVRDAALSHVLLISSHVGAMEFRTGLSQVLGNHRVAGVGFYVSADGRVTNTQTGAVSDGYLAPFVQLRLTLLETAAGKVLKNSNVGDGYIVGPPAAEAPDPWRFLNRTEKAQALQALLQTTVTRGVNAVLETV